MSMSVPRPFTQFRVPDSLSEEVGWKAKLSKWQWALVIGVPLAAAAAVAGLALVVSWRRRRDAGTGKESPQPSMSSTPVASPTPTTRPANTSGKERVCCVPFKEHQSAYLVNVLALQLCNFSI